MSAPANISLPGKRFFFFLSSTCTPWLFNSSRRWKVFLSIIFMWVSRLWSSCIRIGCPSIRRRFLTPLLFSSCSFFYTSSVFNRYDLLTKVLRGSVISSYSWDPFGRFWLVLLAEFCSTGRVELNMLSSDLWTILIALQLLLFLFTVASILIFRCGSCPFLLNDFFLTHPWQ